MRTDVLSALKGHKSKRKQQIVDNRKALKKRAASVVDRDDSFSSRELHRIFGSGRIQACSTPLKGDSGGGEERKKVNLSGILEMAHSRRETPAKKVSGELSANNQEFVNTNAFSTELPTFFEPMAANQLSVGSQGSERSKAPKSTKTGPPRSRKSSVKRTIVASSDQKSTSSASHSSGITVSAIPPQSSSIAAKWSAPTEPAPKTPPPPKNQQFHFSPEKLRIKSLYYSLLSKCTPGPDPLTLLPYKKCPTIYSQAHQ